MKLRYLWEITEDELSDLIREFLRNARLVGSVAQVYDLWSVIHAERDKALEKVVEARSIVEKMDET